MKIDPKASGFSMNGPEGQVYKRAAKVIDNFKHLSADLVSLDGNSAVDNNPTPGQISVLKARIGNPPPAADESDSLPDIETEASGVLLTDDKKNVQMLEVYGKNESGFRYHESHGGLLHLGLGEKRQVFQQDDTFNTQQVVLFADGRLSYEEFPRTI